MDRETGAGEPCPLQDAVKVVAGDPDEGFPDLGFLFTGGFPDKEDPRAGGTVEGDVAFAVAVEVAAEAGGGFRTGRNGRGVLLAAESSCALHVQIGVRTGGLMGLDGHSGPPED